jgi:hypothetical protein
MGGLDRADLEALKRLPQSLGVHAVRPLTLPDATGAPVSLIAMFLSGTLGRAAKARVRAARSAVAGGPLRDAVKAVS